MSSEQHLSRRERQIMDVLHSKGRATAADIRESIPSPPSYSAVRALLKILENKGHIKHSRDGVRYVYLPKTSQDVARRSALDRVISFFQGSVGQAAAALLERSDTELSQEQLDKLQDLIDKARKEGR